MNTKGAAWVGKAEIERISLHTLEFRSQSRHSVFFTLGEEGVLSLRLESDADAAFALIHTESDYIIFHPGRTISSFKGMRTEAAAGPGSSLKAEKKGSEITFTGDDGYTFKASYSGFLASASIGIVTEGEGHVKLEVF